METYGCFLSVLEIEAQFEILNECLVVQFDWDTHMLSQCRGQAVIKPKRIFGV